MQNALQIADVYEGEFVEADALSPAELDAEFEEARADYDVIATLLFAAECGDASTVRAEVTKIADLEPPKYPHISAQFLSYGGNAAVVVLGRVATALRRAGIGEHRIREFVDTATSRDANFLVRTVARWVTVA